MRENMCEMSSNYKGIYLGEGDEIYNFLNFSDFLAHTVKKLIT
jgi:hypothetical protein